MRSTSEALKRTSRISRNRFANGASPANISSPPRRLRAEKLNWRPQTPPNQPQQGKEEFSSGDSETDNDAGDDENDDSTPVEGGGGNNDASEVQAGHNEIWRFMIKTDSPHEIRPRIVKLLTELNIPSNTPGIGGTEAPGGIQFDLLVPPEVVGEVKKQLQAMAPKAPTELAKTPAGETFTWYKNKAKTKLPEHKTRIVIWLSQM